MTGWLTCFERAIRPGALVYIASEDPTKNENYLGPASVGELAAQIASARGPSGPNAEYLYRLVDALVQVRPLGTTSTERSL